jgi:acetyltransferase-like isoleucine patch superfamily enzyme
MYEIGRIFRLLVKITRLLLVRLRYSQWTVAEYYRKQGARIGENCRIEFISFGEEPYLISIGNHVFIAPNVVLHTHDGGAWILRDEIPNIQILGKINIEDNCLIGANAHLLPNVRIGSNSIVGAGSVVITDVPPNSIVMGVPARIIGSTIKYEHQHVAVWNKQVAEWNERIAAKKTNNRGRRWWPFKQAKNSNQEFVEFLTDYDENNKNH